MRLSIVMASMNEEASIRGMIEAIKQHTPVDTEILLVDSSKDKTPEIARSLGARVITQAPQGHGMALKKGLNEAQGEVVVTMDCDLTYPIERVLEFVNLVENQGYDLVSGCRLTPALKKEMPFFNKIANFGFALIVRVLYGIKTHDVTTGMFAMKKELAHTAWAGNFSIPSEIIIRSQLMGKKYLEVPISYKLRMGESTLPKWRSGKAYLRCFFRWKWNVFVNSEL